jgi:EmrB/QacA subfamily drug resistance transporter
MSATTETLGAFYGARTAGLRKWAALPVVLAGTFMVVLDFFIVNVAMPTMQSDLNAGANAIQWVVAGYGLAFAAGLITGGRLGDQLGRRRMFTIGLALFVLTSAACGVAPSAGLLVAARVAQGASSALLMPQVLAILGVAYTGPDRLKALMAYTMTLGIAAVGGQLVGGILIELDPAGLDWRACFLVNVPVGLLALAFVGRTVPESRAGETRLDLLGTDMITVGLVAILLPLIEGRDHGWPAWTWASFAVAGVVLVAFGLYQRRVARRGGSPLVPPELFAERAFTAGLGTTVLFFVTVASFFLVLALELQEGRGLDPLESGLVFGFEGIGFFAATLVSGKFVARLGRQALALGALVRAVALVALYFAVDHIGAHGSVAWLAGPMLLDGAGLGLVMGPIVAIVLAGVAPRNAGAASGVLATAQQIGNALGVAIIGVVFFGALESGHTVPDAFRTSLLWLAAGSVLVAALIQALPRGERASSEPAAAEPAAA